MNQWPPDESWVYSPSGTLARIYGTLGDGKRGLQYFDPYQDAYCNDCPNKCLEGDGGYTVIDPSGFTLCETPPKLMWCECFDEECYRIADK